MSPRNKKAEESLTARINTIVKHRKLRQIEVAALIGFSETYVKDMLRGVRQWNPQSIDKFCKALDLGPDDENTLHTLGAQSKGWKVKFVNKYTQEQEDARYKE